MWRSIQEQKQTTIVILLAVFQQRERVQPEPSRNNKFILYLITNVINWETTAEPVLYNQTSVY